MSSTGTGDTQSGQLERICLSRLFPSSAHPVHLLGRFSHGEITYILAPDADISWTRAADMSAEAFENLVIDALLELRGLPTARAGYKGTVARRSYASIGE